MKNIKLGTKLLLLFLAVGLIPFATVGLVSLYRSSEALSEQAYNQLLSMREIKKAQIEKFFDERTADMGVLMETVATLRREAFAKLAAIQEIKKARLRNNIEGMKAQLRVLRDNEMMMNAFFEFDMAFEEGGKKAGTTQWNGVAGRYDPRMKRITENNGWYDIFLINPKGDIVYSIARESDLGMNLGDGELKDQGLGRAFLKARNAEAGAVVVADLAPYSPSHGMPAGFMMTQLRDVSHELLGYVAFRISLERINAIMHSREGMGNTGESYLVGTDGLMRSDSFLDRKGHSVAASFANHTQVDTVAVREALAGNGGQKVIVDYNGKPVLSCWAPVELGDGIRWAMITEINVAEAFSPVDEKGNAFYAKYTKLYGYYDLFLINPDGFVFYTVTREADYHTNLINGKYASSNLGRLMRQVLDSKRFGMADFAPYAPSKNQPCAFIAQPVVNEGKVEMVIALQLSMDAINRVMSQRDGMGNTGETYLVGSDRLMRSDSYLDPTHHSVVASFADPAAGKVDTTASREALSGKSGQKIIENYNGNPVLSAYTPLTICNITWALIAEIDKSEAFAAVNGLKWVIGVLALIGAGAIGTLAVLFSRSVTRPINRVIEGLQDGASQVTSASNQISSASQSLAEGASEQAASIEETSSSLEEMASMTKQNAGNADQADTLMKAARQIVDKANRAMGELTTSMRDISHASEETAKIVKTIDEIAFQTNLLALNAAVEAARAGEAGAGFAVVADEVRNLAIRAADAAKNTADLIDGTVNRIKNGSELVETTNTAFAEVAESSAKAATLVGDIATASQEQSQGIEQINKAVAEMDKVTQQNAANAEQSASAAEEMNAQAAQMMAFVSELVQLIGGGMDQEIASGDANAAVNEARLLEMKEM